MIPRECDNDDCEDEGGRWLHVEGCEPMPPLTEKKVQELRRVAAERPGSLLASFFPDLKETTR